MAVDLAVHVEGRDKGGPHIREAGDPPEEGVRRRETGLLRFLVMVMVMVVAFLVDARFIKMQAGEGTGSRGGVGWGRVGGRERGEGRRKGGRGQEKRKGTESKKKEKKRREK